MTIAELFSYLHSLDVQIWADGDRLRINAPKGVLSPELNAELVERKAELLAFLKRAMVASDDSIAPIQPAPPDQAVPLSFSQQRIWFLDQLDPGNRAYILSGAFHIKGALDVNGLEQSVNEIVRRHAILRTSFVLENGQPVQRVSPTLSVELPVVDLRQIERPAREAHAEQLMREALSAPFDLASAPLFSITLYRLDAEEYTMLMRIHHIITDGVSMEIFLREVAIFYQAAIEGRVFTLPELPIQYADFAHWQRQWLQGPALENQLAFWKKQLAGSPPVLELLPDHARPPVQSYRGAKMPWQLPVALSQSIKSLSRKSETTVFMFLLAAFKVLLYRHTGQSDILVGTPISGRNRAETEGLMGCFLNNLVLRTDLAGDPSFRELLKRVREVSAAAFAHQDIPFEKLVEELHPERDVSRSPLFQVMFLQNSPTEVIRLADLTVTPFRIDNGAAIMDLAMYFQEDSSQDNELIVTGVLEYNTDLYEEATMRRLLEHFEILLAACVEDPDQPISALPLLSDAERQQMVVEWNRTASDYPKDQCLHHLFESQVQHSPDAIAVLFDGNSLSYRELNQRADQLAAYLQSLGVGAGTLVAICVERSLDMLVGLLAILKAGGAYLPLDASYPEERLAFMLDDAQVPLLITQQQLKENLPENKAKLLCLDTDWSEIAAYDGKVNIAAAPQPDHLAYVIYTSGSTGKPKGVQVTHRSVVNFMTAMQQRPGIDSRDSLLTVTTLSFDIAALELFLPLTVGAKVVIATREVATDGTRLAHLLAESQATVMQATPVTWRLLLEAGWPGNDQLKILCGGEALPRDLANQLLLRCSSLWNMYGPTETTIWSTVERVEAGSDPISIGRPIANTQIYVLDSRLHPAPLGVPGDLYIAGDGLAAGYLNRSQLTAERFVANPFYEGALAVPMTQLATQPAAFMYKTGDLARYLANGKIDFLGRADFQVKVRGHRIELGEIEALLASHRGIAQAVVVVREDEPGQQRLVAYAIPAEGAHPSVDDLRRSLKEQLPDYMVPMAFVMLERFPLTPNNKIDRRALPIPDTARPELETKFITPQTELEQIIAGVWMEVLKLDKVGVHDNFFDLGGHSLLLAQVHSRLKEQLGVELTIIKLFQYPSIAALAGYLSEQVTPSVAEQAARRTIIPTSDEAIAIVGLAGRFPGAKNIDEFWSNLRDGVEGIVTFSEQELREQGLPPELLAQPNYVRAKAVLADSEMFDATFFGINPREAEVTDPQHRLFLECAWEALENSGYTPATYSGAIGVYAGASINSYLLANLLPGASELDTAGAYQLFVGNDKDFLPTRVSYKLDLRGPSISIQTACSTSLVAVHYACRGLLNHECDMALAGGVSAGFPQKAGYLYQEGMIFSPDGHCRAFDAQAKGTVSGEGVGVVVLKRLSEALADEDQIYAVIRGSAVNNDGAGKVGYTAPSVGGQAAVIHQAQLAAGVSPDDISYVEAHGTATPLGDPVEIAALTQVFGSGAGREAQCAIGSVKTNIGHLDAAAGVAGLIKTVLALQYKQIPPSLHFTMPNPEIGFDEGPFYVNAHLSEWMANGAPRRAGVSSFGIGGTNAHVVLEEAPELVRVTSKRPWRLLTLSARSATALDKLTANLADYLSSHPELDMADVAFTLQMGRKHFDHRRIAAVADRDDAIRVLQNRDANRLFTHAGPSDLPAVVFMFPGQGAQYEQMGRGIYESEPIFRQSVDHCCEILQPYLGLDLRPILYPESDQPELNSEQLSQTAITQPALFTIEYALAQLWMSWGVQPKALIGHSIGEYVAACLAGVFSLEEALRIVAARGRLMQQLPPGKMLTIALPEEKVRAFLNGGDVAVAAVNAPSLCVVSGQIEAIDTLHSKLLDREIDCRVLHTSHAFHSPMMAPAVEALSAELATVRLLPPQLPFVSNVTGTWITAAEATDPSYWLKHTLQAVRFAEGILTLSTADPNSILLEVGPGHTLSQLARQQPPQQPPRSAGLTVLSSMRHPREQRPDMELLMTTVGRLWLTGVRVDWPALAQEEHPRRVHLPAYPFERERFSITPGLSRQHVNQAAKHNAKKADIADWFYVPSWQRAPILKAPEKLLLGEQRITWLLFCDTSGLGSEVARQIAAQGHEVISVKPGKRFEERGEHEILINPQDPNDYSALFQALVRRETTPDRIVHLWSVSPGKMAKSTMGWDDEAQTMGFYSLLYLVQALAQDEIDKEIQLFVLSTGLYDVSGDEELDPAKGTLPGICRVIPQEYPNISCRNIDLLLPTGRTTSTSRQSDQILLEIAKSSTEPVVAYRGASRWVQTFAPIQLPAVAPNAVPVREHGVYLITGGLGDVAYAVASYLAQSVKAKLVLIGRTILPPRAEWEEWLATYPANNDVSIKIRKVQSLEEMGAEVLLASADVADEMQMASVVEQTYTHFGALHGVIHTAGTVEMTLLSRLDRSACEQQFNAKGKGLLVLAKVLQGKPLDFCFVTSSLSAILGGLGYAAYAAANAYMDAFVQWHNRGPGVAWSVVDWDGWVSAADIDPKDSRTSALIGFAMMPAEGVETFVRIVGEAPGSHLVVSTGDLAARVDRHVRHSSPRVIEVQSPYQQAEQASRVHGQEYIAPRDAREEAIARIWRDILGIQEISVDANFFEIGGTSLVAVRMFDRIERTFGTKLPLATLLDAQTIAELAAILVDVEPLSSDEVQAPKKPARRAASGWSSLVAIQPNGSKPPLFCVHAAGGNVLLYRDLSRHLGLDQPVYGIQAQGLDGQQPILQSVEEMASLYVDNIKSLQSQGPYLLSGYCMGGTVALEMAQRLRAQGDEVGLVGLFETYNWHNMKLESLPTIAYFLMQKFEFHARNFMLLNRPGKRIFLEEKLKVLYQRREVISGSLRKLLGRDKQQHKDMALLLADLWEANDRISMVYQPKAYPGKISHFRPMKEYKVHKGPALGWESLAEEVETHWVPAYPAGMMVEPFVGQLAASLKDCIDRALVKPAIGENHRQQATSIALVQSNGDGLAPHHVTTREGL